MCFVKSGRRARVGSRHMWRNFSKLCIVGDPSMPIYSWILPGTGALFSGSSPPLRLARPSGGVSHPLQKSGADGVEGVAKEGSSIGVASYTI